MVDLTTNAVISKWHTHLDNYGVKRSTSSGAPAASWKLGHNWFDVTVPHGNGDLPSWLGVFNPQTSHDSDIAFADGQCHQSMIGITNLFGDGGEMIKGGSGEDGLFHFLGKAPWFALQFRSGCGNLHGEFYTPYHTPETRDIDGQSYAVAPIGATCVSDKFSFSFEKDLEWCGSMSMDYFTGSNTMKYYSGKTTVFQLQDLQLPHVAFEYGAASRGSSIDAAARLSALEIASLPGTLGYESMKSPNKGLILGMPMFVSQQPASLKIRNDAIGAISTPIRGIASDA